MNLDPKHDWSQRISQINEAVPNNLSVLGKMIKIGKPYAILLVNQQTMNELLALGDYGNGFFLKYEQLDLLNHQSESKIKEVLTSRGERDTMAGQPGFVSWFARPMIEWLISRLGLIVPPKEPYVVLCPDAILARSRYVEDFMKRVIGTKINHRRIEDRTIECILRHELGHICCEKPDAVFEPRLSEGLANFFTFQSTDKLGKQVLHALACSSDMDFRRNYYHLMRYYGGASDVIISNYLDGMRGEAFKVFAELRRHAEAFNAIESDGGRFRTGAINGEAWIAYGAKRYSLSVASELPYLCNIKSGSVIAASIGRIVGFLNPDLKVVTNRLGFHEYPQLPANIKVVKETDLNIAHLVKEELIPGKVDEEEIIRSYF